MWGFLDFYLDHSISQAPETPDTTVLLQNALDDSSNNNTFRELEIDEQAAILSTSYTLA